MQRTTIDGGILGFDRNSGRNILHVSEDTRALTRRAPRTLQVGVLTPWNMSCAFCYRDQRAPSLLQASS